MSILFLTSSEQRAKLSAFKVDEVISTTERQDFRGREERFLKQERENPEIRPGPTRDPRIKWHSVLRPRLSGPRRVPPTRAACGGCALIPARHLSTRAGETQGVFPRRFPVYLSTESETILGAGHPLSHKWARDKFVRRFLLHFVIASREKTSA